MGGRGRVGGGNDLSGKAFYPVTWLDNFINFSGKAKPPGYPVAIPGKTPGEIPVTSESVDWRHVSFTIHSFSVLRPGGRSNRFDDVTRITSD